MARFVVLLSAAVLAGMLSSGRALAEEAERCPSVGREHRGKVVARVGRTKITVCDVTEALGKMSPHLRKAYRGRQKQLQLVDNMIRFEVIAAEARRRGLADDPEVLRVSQQMMVRELVRQRQAKVVIPPITEADVEAYYQAHRGDYVKSETVRVARIRCDTEAACERVLQLASAKARDGSFFRDLARAHSTDRHTRKRGGDLPYVSREGHGGAGETEVDSAIVNAAFTLEMAEPLFPRVVKSSDGWNVIRLRGKRKARRLERAEVEQQIRHRLRQDRLGQAQAEHVAALRKRSRVRIWESALAKARIDLSRGPSADLGAAESPTSRRAEKARRRTRVARVGARVITLGELEDQLGAEGPLVRARYGSADKRRAFLDQMIDLEVQAQEARRRGLHDVPAVDQQVKRVMSTLLLRRACDELVRPEDVTEGEARAYYTAHLSAYHRPERVRAYHILISDEARAAALLGRVRTTGVDAREFRRLARTLSEDTLTKRRGGDLRYFPLPEHRSATDQEVAEPVVRAAFTLLHERRRALGSASSKGSSVGFDPVYPDLVKTKAGFHIVRFMGHRDAVSRSFEEVERQIKNRIWRDKLQERRGAFVETLRARSGVKVDEGNLRFVEIGMPSTPSSAKVTRPRVP